MTRGKGDGGWEWVGRLLFFFSSPPGSIHCILFDTVVTIFFKSLRVASGDGGQRCIVMGLLLLLLLLLLLWWWWWCVCVCECVRACVRVCRKWDGVGRVVVVGR